MPISQVWAQLVSNTTNLHEQGKSILSHEQDRNTLTTLPAQPGTRLVQVKVKEVAPGEFLVEEKVKGPDGKTVIKTRVPAATELPPGGRAAPVAEVHAPGDTLLFLMSLQTNDVSILLGMQSKLP